ncbi:HEPN domain-containing protein [Moorella sulfitireducens (nom. illeg.)]|uniref:HEPN domain-containing protein n=1 Tax=Neomoorella sulfitireducens TaxID=2972948 RepID=UPI0021AB9F3D|nr:HEPN domain-containing protein [Moorella sulfitireducens]
MQENRETLAKYWMDKARRSLNTARREFEEKNYDFCANRLYYAAFYAVSAVLMLQGKYYKKHSGVRAALHRDLVKPGIIPEEYGTLYDALLRDREEIDYIAFVEPDPEVIKEEITKVEELLNILADIMVTIKGKDQ